jgi:hypothetical protein
VVVSAQDVGGKVEGYTGIRGSYGLITLLLQLVLLLVEFNPGLGIGRPFREGVFLGMELPKNKVIGIISSCH